jgi:hypothetical protein
LLQPAAAPTTPIPPQAKPLDRWLGMIAIAVGILYWFIPEKTFPRVVASLFVIFALLVHPIWNFWWIEKKWWRRVGTLLLVAVGLSAFGYFTWQSRTRTINQLTALASKRDWSTLSTRLARIEVDHAPELHDVDLYFRGILFSNFYPGPDPERYLAQIPPDSDLFESAQEIRLHNYARAPSVELGTAIMNSLDRASLRNHIYYALRLELSPNLTFDEISPIYDEFATRYRNLFDFTNMKSNISVYQGVPMQVDIKDVFEAPGCVLLFLYSELYAAHRECLVDREREILSRYDMLMKNVGNAVLNMSTVMSQFGGTATMEQRIEEIRNQLNSKCSVKAK